MNSEEVYITANPTPNPECLKFIVDRQLVDGEALSFQSAKEAEGSPLALKLFDLGHVTNIFAFQNFITVTKTDAVYWQEFAREVGKTIRAHIQSGEKNFEESVQSQAGEDNEAVRAIKDVLDEIRPSVAMDGGNIVFAGYKDGVVQVFMQGSCSGCPSSTLTLRAGIEARLKEVLPEVTEVVAIS
ncbi:MAG: NifU family protein [Acidobacteria bacterium]|nr:NifU family protein [Acidobacteriota bacterium]